MIDFKVTPEDGEAYEVTADSRDIYVWEKRHKKQKTFGQLMDNLAMVDMMDIAYIASTREGLFDGKLDEFVRSCKLTFELEEDEPDPTQPEASPEP